MKPTLIISFLTLSFLAVAQPNITIGDVFKFQVGDEFHKHHTSWGDIRHTHETVKKVTYNTDSSSVTYEMEVLVWSGKKGYVPITRVSTYDDLDSNIGFLIGKEAFENAPNRYFLRHDETDSFYLAQDTIYEFIDTLTFRDSCGRLNFKYRSWEDNILDPGVSHDVYGLGLGKVITYRFDGQGTWGSGYEKVFWKSGGDSCGYYDPLFVKTEKPRENGIECYPNPTSAEKGIFLNIAEQSQITIINTSGQLVSDIHDVAVSGNTQIHVHTQGLTNGIYILKIQSVKSGTSTFSRFVIH